MRLYSSTDIKEVNQRNGLLFPSVTLKNSELTSIASEKKSKRIPALDFTKGALVLIMVLYHWMNYFVMTDGSIYKYLRFLTPSFIFITGFLVSQVYLSKYQTSGLHVAKRLMVRGFKLLGIVLFLNLAISTMRFPALETRVGDWSLGDMMIAYLTGAAPVAFSVLVPIAYLLILSAGLLVFSRRYRNIYHFVCAAFVACAFIFELKGIKTGYLQIFSIGLLGISIGYLPINRINHFAQRPLAIFVAYLAYLAAITFCDDVYLLQIIGVCLSLALIYWTGIGSAEATRIGKVTVVLGQYSLFAYIAQIVILQILKRTLRPLGGGIGVSGSALLACLACTILSVVILDRGRIRMVGLNRFYSAVFG